MEPLGRWFRAHPAWITDHDKGHPLPPSSLITYESLFWSTSKEKKHLVLFFLERLFVEWSIVSTGAMSEFGNLEQDALKVILMFVVDPFDAHGVYDLFSFLRLYETDVLSRFKIYESSDFWKCLTMFQFMEKDDKYASIDLEDVETLLKKIVSNEGTRAHEIPDVVERKKEIRRIRKEEIGRMHERRCAYWDAVQDYFWDFFPRSLRGKIEKTVPGCLKTLQEAKFLRISEFESEMKRHQIAFFVNAKDDGLLENRRWIPRESEISEWVKSYSPRGGKTFLSSGGEKSKGLLKMLPEDLERSLNRPLTQEETKRLSSSSTSATRLCDELLFYEYLVKSCLGHELKTFGTRNSKKSIVPNGTRKVRMGFAYDCLWVHRRWENMERMRSLKKNADEKFFGTMKRSVSTWDSQTKRFDRGAFSYRGRQWYYDDDSSGNPKCPKTEAIEKRFSSRRGDPFEAGLLKIKSPCHLFANRYDDVVDPFADEDSFDKPPRKVKLCDVTDPFFDLKIKIKSKEEYVYSLDHLYENLSSANCNPFDAEAARTNALQHGRSVFLVGPFHVAIWYASDFDYYVSAIPFCFDFDDPEKTFSRERDPLYVVSNGRKREVKTIKKTNNPANDAAWTSYRAFCKRKNASCSESFPSFGTIVGCSPYDHCAEGRIMDGEEIKITSEGKAVLILDYECFLRASAFTYENANERAYASKIEATKNEISKLMRSWVPLCPTTKILFSVDFSSTGACRHEFLGIVDPLSLDNAASSRYEPNLTFDRPEIRFNGISADYAKTCNALLFDRSWRKNNPSLVKSTADGDFAPFRFEGPEDFEESKRADRFPSFHSDEKKVSAFLGFSDPPEDVQRLCFNPVVSVSSVCGTKISTCVVLNYFHGNSVVIEVVHGTKHESRISCDVVHAGVTDKYANFNRFKRRREQEKKPSPERKLFDFESPSRRRPGLGSATAVPAKSKVDVDADPNKQSKLSDEETLLFLASSGFRRRFDSSSRFVEEEEGLVSTICYSSAEDDRRFTAGRRKKHHFNKGTLISKDRVYRRFTRTVASEEGGERVSKRVVKEFDRNLSKPDDCATLKSLKHEVDVLFKSADFFSDNRPLGTRATNVDTLFAKRKRASGGREALKQRERPNVLESNRESSKNSTIKMDEPYLLPGLEFASAGIRLDEDLCATHVPDMDFNGCKRRDEGCFYYEGLFVLKCYTGSPAPFRDLREKDARTNEIVAERAWNQEQFTKNHLFVLDEERTGVTRKCNDFPICHQTTPILVPKKEEEEGEEEEMEGEEKYEWILPTNSQIVSHEDGAYRNLRYLGSKKMKDSNPAVSYLNVTTDGLLNDALDFTARMNGRWKGKTVNMYPEPVTLFLISDFYTGKTIRYVSEIPTKTICVYKNLHVGVTSDGDVVVHALPEKKSISIAVASDSVPDAYDKNAPFFPGLDFTCPVVHRAPLFACNARSDYGSEDPEERSWYHDPITCVETYENVKKKKIYVVFCRSFEKGTLSRFTGVFPDYEVPGFSDSDEPCDFRSGKRIPSRFEIESFSAQDPNFWICVELSSDLLIEGKRKSKRKEKEKEEEATMTSSTTKDSSMTSKRRKLLMGHI